VRHIFVAIAIGVVGVFLLASGFQASPIHLKWIKIGGGLIAGAFFAFFVLKPEREEYRP
jgi:hypothetical protein